MGTFEELDDVEVESSQGELLGGWGGGRGYKECKGLKICIPVGLKKILQQILLSL